MKSAVLAALVASPLLGQAPETCALPEFRDSVTAYVVVNLRGIGAAGRMPAWYGATLVQEIGSRVVLPTPMAFPSFNFPPPLRDERVRRLRGYPGLHALFALTLDTSGIGGELLVSSSNPAFDSAILAAVAALDSARAIPTLPDELTREPLRLQLVITTDLSDSNGETLLAARVPLIEFTSMAAPLRTSRPPRYPDDLRKANVEGQVIVRFGIDASGRTTMGSIMILHASDHRFAQAVIDYLGTARFEPARIGDCPVSVLTQQPFHFTLSR